MSSAVVARDDLYKLVSQEYFFERNPAFAALQAEFANCKTAYEQSANASKCGCGGATKLIVPCLDAVLNLAEQLKIDNPEAIQSLVSYLAEKRSDPNIKSFTVYYRVSAAIPLRKISFP